MYVFKGARALSVTDPGVGSHVMVKLAEKEKKVWCHNCDFRTKRLVIIIPLGDESK